MLIGTITSHINYFFSVHARKSPLYSYARPFIVSGEPSIPSIVVENKGIYSIGTLVLIQESSNGYETVLPLSAVTDVSGNPITEGNASSLNIGTVTGDLDVCGSLSVGVSALFTSSVNVSGDVNGMPYPPPYAHIRMNVTGVNSDDQYNFASGAANIYTVSSDANHFTWDDTDKELDVCATGEYEVTLDAAAQTDTTNNQITSRIKVDGVLQTSITHRVNTATDPHPISIAWIGSITSGQSITVTIDGTENTQLMAGSSITVKRVS